MSFCVKCGAYVPMEETVCPACGFDPERETGEQPFGQGAAQQQQAPPQQEPRQEQQTTGGYYDSAKDPWESARQTADPWGEKKADQGPWSAQQKYTPPWEDPKQWGGVHRQTSWQEDRGTDYAQRARDSVGNQSLSVLSYLGPLFLIPLFVRQGDPFARFHANQGLVLFLTEALVSVAANAIPGLGWLVNLAGGIFAISCLIKGIRSVLAGRLDKLPLIGDITLIK